MTPKELAHNALTVAIEDYAKRGGRLSHAYAWFPVREAIEAYGKVYAAEQVAEIKDERDAAYLELRKQKPAITAIYDRDVWIKVDKAEGVNTHEARRARGEKAG